MSNLTPAEAAAAMRELCSLEPLVNGARGFLPAPVFNEIWDAREAVQSVEDFQRLVSQPFFKMIERASITELSLGGLERLDRSKKYLFLSNHRDIVLDSAFLNTSKLERGWPTSQIAIGDNLMKWRSSELIFQLNKSFSVRRSGSPMELYRASVGLSQHIFSTVSGGKSSIWLAQREGRAKDGEDRTQPSLLKMLSLSDPAGGTADFFRSLRIVPTSISYEFNPCDTAHAREFLQKQADPNFKKTFEQDLKQILLGLQGTKGEVRIQFAEPLDAGLDELFADPQPRRRLERLAAEIDRAIHQNYRLHEVNRAALALLEGEPTAGFSAEILAFFDRKKVEIGPDPTGLGWRYLLGIYANPLKNQRAAMAF